MSWMKPPAIADAIGYLTKEELDRIDRAIIQLKIEAAALQKDGNSRKAKHLNTIEAELKD